MAEKDNLQSQRFELKFHINEAIARGVRDFAASYLVADEFNDPANNNAYPVNSLYVDSPALNLFRATVKGEKNRYKLRIRFYDEEPDSPVFFEIKQRKNDVILKQRAAVYRDSVMPILTGHVPRREDLLKPSDAKSLYALQRFCQLKDELKADGQAFVSYMREAYVAPDSNDVRLTFDRNLVARPYLKSIIMPSDEYAIRPKVPTVVLELKFTDRFPNWMHELVSVFNLRRESMPKYVECLQSLRTGDPARSAAMMNMLRSELQ